MYVRTRTCNNNNYDRYTHNTKPGTHTVMYIHTLCYVVASQLVSTHTHTLALSGRQFSDAKISGTKWEEGDGCEGGGACDGRLGRG